MRAIAKWGTLPVVLTVLTAITALYYLLVAFGNITDFRTNFDFVDNVFDMGSTFNDKDVMWRRIQNNGLVTVAYVCVIIWETLIAGVLLTALYQWLRGNRELGRRLSVVGWTMGLILFGGLFITIGGEWFSMWQSSKWNGLEPAFRNFTIAGIGLILAHLPGALGPVAAGPAAEAGPKLLKPNAAEVRRSGSGARNRRGD
jgi:predicted small integral membrane protein